MSSSLPTSMCTFLSSKLSSFPSLQHTSSFDIILGVFIVVVFVSPRSPLTSFLSPPFSPLRLSCLCVLPLTSFLSPTFSPLCPSCLLHSPLYVFLVSAFSPLRPSCLLRSPLYVLLVSPVLPFSSFFDFSISLSPNLPGPHFSSPVS